MRRAYDPPAAYSIPLKHRAGRQVLQWVRGLRPALPAPRLVLAGRHEARDAGKSIGAYRRVYGF